MNQNLNPGRGLRVLLKKDQDTPSDLRGVFEELEDAYTSYREADYEGPAYLADILADDCSWERSEDEWGHKATSVISQLDNGGEIRITVVQKSPKDDVVVDIREWWRKR
jgi:hypothetical protein